MFVSIDEWESLFASYRKKAALLFEREGWVRNDPRWEVSVGATSAQIAQVEERLGVTFPPDLHSFYRACDGWPADGWINPAINRLGDVNWLEAVNPSVYRLAVESESVVWNGRAEDDPDLLDYRLEQGTRVKRPLGITSDKDDQPTLLFDVLDEWRFGSWAHWNPAMKWHDDGFTEYMVCRFERMLDD